MKKYENIYIYTDIDGTISDWNYNIPEANIEGIRYFTENGGHFGIATGRGKDGVAKLAVAPYINLPCILSNGAVITNLNEDSPIYAKFMPKKAKEVALEIRDKFPTIAIYCWGIKTRFDMSDKEFCKREDTFKNTVVRPIEEVSEPWTRLLFYSEPSLKEEMTSYIKKLSKDQLEITTSGKSCIGLMAKGVNKGTAVREMADKFSVERKNLYVLGDFDNDLTMLSIESANSFCPSTAEENVKSTAKYILSSVDKGIIPDLLKKIDENLK